MHHKNQSKPFFKKLLNIFVMKYRIKKKEHWLFGGMNFFIEIKYNYIPIWFSIGRRSGYETIDSAKVFIEENGKIVFEIEKSK